MLISRRTAWAATAAALALVAAGAAAWSAEAAVKIAVVDVQKILSDAPRIRQYTEQLESLKQTLAKKLEIRSQNLMLEENEIRELVDLKLKANATDQEKARIKEITDIERARDEELKKLQSTAQPTDQQKARQKELTDMQQRSKTTGEALEKDYNSQLQTTYQELMSKSEADIREAITKIAEDKGFAVVLTKDAALFGGTNITDDVIAKLDRKIQ